MADVGRVTQLTDGGKTPKKPRVIGRPFTGKDDPRNNLKGRPRKEDTLRELLQSISGECITDTSTTHEEHWWRAVAHALDLLAEGISSGSFQASELSGFKVLMELWHDRAHGKPAQTLAGDPDRPLGITVAGLIATQGGGE